MPQLDDTVEILSPPETVWRVLSDPTFLPKLYDDAVTVEVDPPGPTVVGQKCRILGRVRDVKVVALAEFTKVERYERLESRAVPGGLFSQFDHSVTLKMLPLGATEVKIVFRYAVAKEYASKVPDMAALDKILDLNFRAYSKNLKDLSELIPLPE